MSDRLSQIGPARRRRATVVVVVAACLPLALLPLGPAYAADHEAHGPEAHGPEAHGPEAHGPEEHGHEAHGPEEHGHEEHGHEEHGREEHGHEEHGHEAHGHEEHGHDHRYEIGIGPGVVYLPGDGAFAAGLHLHVIRALGERWGLGIGAERIFDEHGHTTLSVVPQFRITDRWSVALAPGITFPDDEPSQIEPSVHLETAYEFLIGQVHLGPSFEVAVDPDESHLTLGMHLGFGF